MSTAKPIRVLLFARLILCTFLFYVLYLVHLRSRLGLRDINTTYNEPGNDTTIGEHTGEPRGLLRRVKDGYAPGPAGDKDRISATLLALVRNDEVDGMVESMNDLELTWNSKFNYPWTFFNNVPFDEEFKKRTQAATNATCHYELIPKEHWEVPAWVNDSLVAESAKTMKDAGVQYASMVSYHQMCRWNSGMFYKHPALENTRYYWRVEPKVHFFCNVDYDVFAYMQDNNKTYGFTISLFDAPQSLTTLWPETVDFLAKHPESLAENNAMDWLTDSSQRPEHNRLANGYSTCHFWSNFEVADMNFWRSKTYEDYFTHLDGAGGFFYERWGDAPVHSIAIGLFEDKRKVHWFGDIGYQHYPFFSCPDSPKCKGCVPGRLTDDEPWLQQEDCRPYWFKHAHMD